MSETVRVKAFRHFPAKLSLHKVFPVKELSDEGFSGRQVAVRLDPHPAGDLPPPFFHPLFDLFKLLRTVFLKPCQKRNTGLGKLKIRKFFHPCQCGSKGRFHLLHAFRPVPEPDRVNMGVSDHKKTLFIHPSHPPILTGSPAYIPLHRSAMLKSHTH